MTADGWNGLNVTRARTYIRNHLPMPCNQCGTPVHPHVTDWGHL